MITFLVVLDTVNVYLDFVVQKKVGPLPFIFYHDQLNNVQCTRIRFTYFDILSRSGTSYFIFFWINWRDWNLRSVIIIQLVYHGQHFTMFSIITNCTTCTCILLLPPFIQRLKLLILKSTQYGEHQVACNKYSTVLEITM